MKKKVLAVLLCLMLVLGILPLSVLAMEPVNGVYRYLKITEVMDQGSTRHNVLLSSDGGATYYTGLSAKGSFDREGDYYTAPIGNVGGLVRVSGVGYKIRLPNGSYIKRTGSIATEGITTTTDVNSATAFDFVSNGSKYAAYEESLTGEYHLVVKNGKLAIEFISDMSPDRDPRYLFTLFTGDLSSNVGLDYISVNIPFEGTDGSGRLNESILLLNATGNSSYGTGKYSQAVPYMNFDVPSHLSTAPGTKVKLTVRTSDPNATYVIRPSDGWHDPVQFIDDRIGYYGDWDYWHGDGKFVGNCLKLEIFVTAPNGNTGSYFVYVAPATVSNSDKRYVVFYSNYPSGSGMSDVYGYREYTRGTTSIDIPTNTHQINVNMPTPAGREFVCWNTKKGRLRNKVHSRGVFVYRF